MKRPELLTVGHSTRSLAELIELLHEARVELLVDVRTVPRSRTNPQFNADTLPHELERAGIAYWHIAALGGLRGRRRGSAPSPNEFWENKSFRNYADYTATPEFRRGLEELERLGAERRSAIMCAEAVWWRCHRRIIADYLLAAGYPVRHLMGPGKSTEAKLTPAASRQPDGTLVYPRADPTEA